MYLYEYQLTLFDLQIFNQIESLIVFYDKIDWKLFRSGCYLYVSNNLLPPTENSWNALLLHSVITFELKYCIAIKYKKKVNGSGSGHFLVNH